MPTLDEIAARLPSGLHDDAITRLAYDVLGGSVTLDIEVGLSTPEEPSDSKRSGQLRFEQALYLAIDPPAELLNDQLWILTYEQSTIHLGNGTSFQRAIHRYRLFTGQRTIEIAAADVVFVWLTSTVYTNNLQAEA